MALKFTNNASSLLAVTLGVSDTVVQVASGEGSLYPSLSGSDTFVIALENNLGDIELCLCTSRTGDLLTVTRGQEGTSIQTWTASQTRVELRLSKAVMEAMLQSSVAATTYVPLTATQATVKGRAAGAGTGDAGDLSAAQLIDILETADGSGSGLDADTLDGTEGSAFATQAGTNAFSGTNNFTGTITCSQDFPVSRSDSGNAVDLRANNGSNTASSHARVTVRVAGSSGGNPYINYEVAGVQQFISGVDNSDSDIWKLQAGAALSGTAGLSLTTASVARYSGLELGWRGLNTQSQSAGYTFVAGDAGRSVAAASAGNFTVNNGVFAAGDIITFINTTGSNCTLVQGAGVTFRLMGVSGTTGNRTVSDFGVATLIAQTSAVFLVGGPGVS
jgi:hypothetical protein